MIDDKIVRRELLEKGYDATFLREDDQLCGAALGECSTDQINQRNG